MTETWLLGQTGEELAANYLSKHGYQILHHNWNLHKGCELDLVARKDGELHFFEVKTRRKVSQIYGGPESAVNAEKQRHIQAAISYYISYYKFEPDTTLHLDVISVVYRNESDYDIKIYEDVYFFEFSRSPYKGRRRGWRYM
ncbi:MAG: YraN family protein [Prevotellaceae bacterium]|nr:YraN family protein [Candidatus Colivivens equi]MCQ2077910.1 YraN family protein [Bacteroidaceae bacterium]